MRLSAIGYTLQYDDLVLAAIAVIGHARFINGPVDELEDLSEEVTPEEVPLLPPVDLQ